MKLWTTTALAAALAAGAQAQTFERIAAFPVPLNLPDGADPLTETSAEIIAASADGLTLVYTDSPAQMLGFIDIADPEAPAPLGALALDGEPTSVAVVGGRAYVGVNTSADYVDTSGRLLAVDIATRAAGESCELGGQPDAVAAAPDGGFVAVAIENERDEDLNDGALPQAPAGFVAIVPIAADGAPDCAGIVNVDLTGLADIGPSDPEPEFVDVNAAGEIVVTMQENNHLAVIGADGAVISEFPAGAVDLDGIDVADDGRLTFDAAQTARRREPDAVKWLDDDRFVIANEGDYGGGAPGFTIFSKSGEVLFESGPAFEYALIRAGHYPDDRSDNKGVEPEGLAVADFDGERLIFVLSERGSAIGVYRDAEGGPELAGLLPSGVGPESAVAIASRGLLVTANEEDLGEDGGPRSHVMIYRATDGAAPYPTLVSGDDADGRPIGWGALSGMVAHPETPGRLYAVSDSFYGMQPSIFEIDATVSPARITRRIAVTRDGAPAQKLDLEGIATDGEGGFWLASEGRAGRLIPHALLHVGADGAIEDEIAFPDGLRAVARRHASEGVTRVGDRLWIAIQREWDDDPNGMVKLLAYDIESGEWGAVHYPLEAAERGWMGLSEITAHDGTLYVVERDNQVGAAAKVKRLYAVSLEGLTPAPLGGDLPVVGKTLVRDLIPDLRRWNGFVVDKVEGFAVDAAGVGFVVTDNDGVDDSSGETFFWSIGPM